VVSCGRGLNDSND